ncbi:hypothetical protein [Lignipirellula cremea]|nr:hypothetical protein [Lignipirellula cremea]
MRAGDGFCTFLTDVPFMNVAYDCPHCDQIVRQDFSADTTEMRCPHCDHAWSVPPTAVVDGRIQQCLICPSQELYVRKDFSQRIGVTIIVIGLAASCIPWFYSMWYTTYGILFGTAIIDALMYHFTGNLLQCYRCHSQYREMDGLDEHGGFDLEVHEKHRQQTIRLAEAERAQRLHQAAADTAAPASESQDG